MKALRQHEQRQGWATTACSSAEQIKLTQRAIKHVLTERWYAWDEARKIAATDAEVNLYPEGGEPAYTPREGDFEVCVYTLCLCVCVDSDMIFLHYTGIHRGGATSRECRAVTSSSTGTGTCTGTRAGVKISARRTSLEYLEP